MTRPIGGTPPAVQVRGPQMNLFDEKGVEVPQVKRCPGRTQGRSCKRWVCIDDMNERRESGGVTCPPCEKGDQTTCK